MPLDKESDYERDVESCREIIKIINKNLHLLDKDQHAKNIVRELLKLLEQADEKTGQTAKKFFTDAGKPKSVIERLIQSITDATMEDLTLQNQKEYRSRFRQYLDIFKECCKEIERNNKKTEKRLKGNIDFFLQITSLITMVFLEHDLDSTSQQSARVVESNTSTNGANNSGHTTVVDFLKNLADFVTKVVVTKPVTEQVGILFRLQMLKAIEKVVLSNIASKRFGCVYHFRELSKYMLKFEDRKAFTAAVTAFEAFEIFVQLVEKELDTLLQKDQIYLTSIPNVFFKIHTEIVQMSYEFVNPFRTIEYFDSGGYSFAKELLTGHDDLVMIFLKRVHKDPARLHYCKKLWDENVNAKTDVIVLDYLFHLYYTEFHWDDNVCKTLRTQAALTNAIAQQLFKKLESKKYIVFVCINEWIENNDICSLNNDYFIWNFQCKDKTYPARLADLLQKSLGIQNVLFSRVSTCLKDAVNHTINTMIGVLHTKLPPDIVFYIFSKSKDGFESMAEEYLCSGRNVVFVDNTKSLQHVTLHAKYENTLLLIRRFLRPTLIRVLSLAPVKTDLRSVTPIFTKFANGDRHEFEKILKSGYNIPNARKYYIASQNSEQNAELENHGFNEIENSTYNILMSLDEQMKDSKEAKFEKLKTMTTIVFVDLDNVPNFFQDIDSNEKLKFFKDENQKIFVWGFYVRDSNSKESFSKKKLIEQIGRPIKARLTETKSSLEEAVDNAINNMVNITHRNLPLEIPFYLLSKDTGFKSMAAEYASSVESSGKSTGERVIKSVIFKDKKQTKNDSKNKQSPNTPIDQRNVHKRFKGQQEHFRGRQRSPSPVLGAVGTHPAEHSFCGGNEVQASDATTSHFVESKYGPSRLSFDISVMPRRHDSQGFVIDHQDCETVNNDQFDIQDLRAGNRSEIYPQSQNPGYYDDPNQPDYDQRYDSDSRSYSQELEMDELTNTFKGVKLKTKQEKAENEIEETQERFSRNYMQSRSTPESRDYSSEEFKQKAGSQAQLGVPTPMKSQLGGPTHTVAQLGSPTSVSKQLGEPTSIPAQACEPTSIQTEHEN